MNDISRKFEFIEDSCVYCEFEGLVIAFQNHDGEQVAVCQGCVEESIAQFDETDLPLRRQ